MHQLMIIYIVNGQQIQMSPNKNYKTNTRPTTPMPTTPIPSDQPVDPNINCSLLSEIREVIIVLHIQIVFIVI